MDHLNREHVPVINYSLTEDCLADSQSGMFLRNFLVIPLVLESLFISKKMLDSTLSMPFIILNTCSISHLLLLCSSDGNPSTFNRSSYRSCFMLGISLVARLCIFSSSTLSRRQNLGCQIKFPYSRCGRTMVVNSRGM